MRCEIFHVLAMTCATMVASATAAHVAAAVAPTDVTGGVAPTMDQIISATYPGIFDEPVALRDGIYEGQPFVEGGVARPRLLLWRDLVAFGQLDDVPGDDAAVLLSASSGGSGERVYLGAVAADASGATVRDTILVGDRTKVRALELVSPTTTGEKGTGTNETAGSTAPSSIVLAVVEAGPRDPACCPTQLARKQYRLSHAGKLELVSSEVEGTLSVRTLDGTRWALAGIRARPSDDATRGGQQTVPTSPTAEFEGARVAGFGGCNRYSAAIEEPQPGTIRIGPIVATRMACPQPTMDEETRYLGRLEHARAYTFLAGHLVMAWQEGEETGTLRFDRVQAIPPAGESDQPSE